MIMLTLSFHPVHYNMMVSVINEMCINRLNATEPVPWPGLNASTNND